ncbi:HNH endonuclease [Streptomyces sp. NPDC048281]|uniref:HNH endonuclease n=1 Tax=Streptomyces sp. NPDC048281 TaxID=3154715 RepID=UPI00343DAEDA
MPRAASICLVRGCTRRTSSSGRCTEHVPRPRAWSRTSSRNQTNRAVARAWERQVRPHALARDGFACVRCGSRERLEVDHVIPIAKGGTWTLDNAQTLCQSCHQAKTADDRRQA